MTVVCVICQLARNSQNGKLAWNEANQTLNLIIIIIVHIHDLHMPVKT